jgi:drug/metabolite transporter (DMT)-like permease
MLRVMISALAHATSDPGFNSTFYATVATVIPVLYLAIAVQGRFFINTAETAIGRARTVTDGSAQLAWLMLGLAFCTVVYGTVGELLALRGLAKQETPHWAVAIVETSATALVILAAMGPTQALLMAFARLRKESTRLRAQARSVGGQRADEVNPG